MMHSNDISFITQNGTKCCEDVLLRALSEKSEER